MLKIDFNSARLEATLKAENARILVVCSTMYRAREMYKSFCSHLLNSSDGDYSFDNASLTVRSNTGVVYFKYIATSKEVTMFAGLQVTNIFYSLNFHSALPDMLQTLEAGLLRAPDSFNGVMSVLPFKER